MIKYRVIYNTASKEFLTLSEAQDFCALNAISLEIIQTIDEPAIDQTMSIIDRAIASKTSSVFRLIADFRNQNIMLGVTQSGKSASIAGLVAMPVTIPNALFPISLLASMQLDTLTAAVAVVDYHIAHIADYSTLTPFITVERLTKFRDDLQALI